jgi:hypothetical protein
MAASATISVARMDGVDGSPSYNLTSLTLKENFNPKISADIGISGVRNQTTNGVGGRLELGVTATESLGSFKGYVRAAVGEYYLRTLNTSYYSIEPGVIIPVGLFNTQIGYRYRNTFSSSSPIQDETNTLRLGISYNLTKKDSVGIRFDRMRGDLNENVTAISYTRNF